MTYDAIKELSLILHDKVPDYTFILMDKQIESIDMERIKEVLNDRTA